MIKKIISSFLAAMLLVSSQAQFALANNDAQTDVANTEAVAYEVPSTIEIMKAIGIDDAAAGNSQHLTRAEFLYNIQINRLCSCYHIGEPI